VMVVADTDGLHGQLFEGIYQKFVQTKFVVGGTLFYPLKIDFF
jgi:hypothetical protein